MDVYGEILLIWLSLFINLHDMILHCTPLLITSWLEPLTNLPATETYSALVWVDRRPLRCVPPRPNYRLDWVSDIWYDNLMRWFVQACQIFQFWEQNNEVYSLWNHCYMQNGFHAKLQNLQPTFSINATILFVVLFPSSDETSRENFFSGIINFWTTFLHILTFVYTVNIYRHFYRIYRQDLCNFSSL